MGDLGISADATRPTCYCVTLGALGLSVVSAVSAAGGKPTGSGSIHTLPLQPLGTKAALIGSELVAV